MIGVVYYTDSALPPRLAAYCWRSLLAAVPLNAAVVYVGHAPCPVDWPVSFAEVVMASARRCQGQIYANIAAGVGALPPVERVYLVEHDCLYLPEHFAAPIECPHLTYDLAQVRLTPDGYLWHRDRPLLSSCSGPQQYVLGAAIERRDYCRRGGRYRWGEFGSGDALAWDVLTPAPDDPPRVVDIRHGGNFTGARRGNALPEVPGWPPAAELWTRLLGDDS
jgi:hypothetical protein